MQTPQYLVETDKTKTQQTISRFYGSKWSGTITFPCHNYVLKKGVHGPELNSRFRKLLGNPMTQVEHPIQENLGLKWEKKLLSWKLKNI